MDPGAVLKLIERRNQVRWATFSIRTILSTENIDGGWFLSRR
jgi:hypothetical protein